MIPSHRQHGPGHPGRTTWRRTDAELRRLIGDPNETPRLAASAERTLPMAYETEEQRGARQLAHYYEQAGERRVLLRDALVALLKDEEPTGAASIFSGCSLPDLEQLGNVVYGKPARLAGTVSTEWAGILGDVVQRLLIEHYDGAPSVARRLCRSTELRTLRARLARPGELPALERVRESGEVTLSGVGVDGYEDMTLVRYARIFSVSTTVIANDDRVALAEVPAQAAEAVKLLEDELFFATLLATAGTGPVLSDGTPFFDASRGNVVAGASPGTTSIGVALAALGNTTGPSGARLNLRGRFLLCSQEDYADALAAVASLTPGGSAPVLEVIGDSNLTDGSWFVFADPQRRPAFVKGSLGGDGRPFVTAAQRFEREAIEWKVSSTLAIGPYDWRCVVRNPGA